VTGASARRAAGVALYLVGLLVFQEAFFRWLFPLPELDGFNRVRYMPLGVSAAAPQPVRSLRLVYDSAPDHARSVHRLNYYGFRGRDWTVARRPGVTRVLFVGSSFVEGALAAERQTLPAVFERAAAGAGGRVEALNLGINAADWTHYDGMITDAVPAFRPDVVVLVLSPIAYLVRQEDVVPRAPAVFARTPGRVPRLAVLAGMLARGEMLPLRWPLRSARVYQPVPDPNNPWTGNERDLAQAVEPFIADAILRGTFNPYRSGFNGHLARVLATPSDFSGELARLGGLVAAQGASLLVAYVPDRAQVSTWYTRFEKSYNLQHPEFVDLTQPAFQVNTRLLEEGCRRLGIPFVDLTPAVRREEDAGRHLYWDYDDHFRPEGYELLGKELWRFHDRSRAGR
jgi:hypothetical protein